MSLVKSSVESPLFIVVDDLIAPNKTLQKKFIEQFGIPFQNALFAEDYQTATHLIQTNSNIAMCFVDCIIPQSPETRHLLKPLAPNQKRKPIESFSDLAQWGLKIVEEHTGINMVIFSAHLTQRQLNQLKRNHQNVIEVAEKPFRGKSLKTVVDNFIVPYFPSPKKKEAIYTSTRRKKSSSFNYEALDPQLAQFLREETYQINLRATRVARDIYNIGKSLKAVKERLAHGEFRAWVTSEFPWSKSQAARLMRVAEVFDISTLEEVNILPSALFELSSKSVPDAARNEVLELAQQGQVINMKIVSQVKEKHLELIPEEEIKTLPLETGNSEGKLQILEIIPGLKENSYWELGSHRLFCGEPNDEIFLKQVPEDIKICFDFSPPEKSLASLPAVSPESGVVYFPDYQNMDLKELESKVKNLILGQTSGGDSILFSYLYHPRLFSLSVQEECICYIAEPNLVKCQSILDLWQNVGERRRIKLK